MDYVTRIFDLPYKAFPYMAKMYHSVSKPHLYPLHPYHHSLLAILCDAMKYHVTVYYLNIPSCLVRLWLCTCFLLYQNNLLHLIYTVNGYSQTLRPSIFFLLFIHLFRSIWTISYAQVLLMHWRGDCEQDGPYSQGVYI